MSTLIVGHRAVVLDDEGWLAQPDQWCEEVAQTLASAQGIPELTEQHWKLVFYSRHYFLEFGHLPMIRKLCKETGISLYDIYNLFPAGPKKGVGKVAGVTQPERPKR